MQSKFDQNFSYNLIWPSFENKNKCNQNYILFLVFQIQFLSTYNLNSLYLFDC